MNSVIKEYEEQSISIPLVLYRSLVNTDTVSLILNSYLEYCLEQGVEIDSKIIECISNGLL